MFEFSERSRCNLETCDDYLQALFNEVLIHHDCTILCGERGEEAQNEAFHIKSSTKQWPDSKHNITKVERVLGKKSQAVDVSPYPIDWKNKKRFYYFAGLVEGLAIRMGIDIIWGGDWDGDNDLDDQDLMDLVHFELELRKD